MITIQQLIDLYAYKDRRTRQHALKDIVQVLLHLEHIHWISIQGNIANLKENMGIEVYLNSNLYFPTSNFTRIYFFQLDQILQSKDSTLDQRLTVFLYVCSYLYDSEGKIPLGNDSTKTYWRSTQTAAKDLGMSKKTFLTNLQSLVTAGLLKKIEIKGKYNYKQQQYMYSLAPLPLVS